MHPRTSPGPACLAAALLALAASSAAASAAPERDAPVAGRGLPLEDPVAIFQRGGPMMYAVLACAVAGAAFALGRLATLRPARSLPEAWDARVRGAFRSAGVRAATELCRKETTPLARVYLELLRRSGAGKQEMKLTAEDACARLERDLERAARPPGAAAAAALLLGLLGAVWGAVVALDDASRLAEPGGREGVLAAGVAQALLPVVFGLAVAIPLLALRYALSRRSETVRDLVEDRALDLGLVLAAEFERDRAEASGVADDIETQTMQPPVAEAPARPPAL